MNINYTLLLNYWYQGNSLLSYFSFIPLVDILILIGSLFLYFGLKYCSLISIKKIFFILLPFYFGALTVSAAIINSLSIKEPSLRFLSIYTNPLTQMVLSFKQNFNIYNRYQTTVSDKQRASIRLQGPLFSTGNPSFAAEKLIHKQSWNIIFFVLESVSHEAAFTNINRHPVMPFLQKMATKSLWLNNNYSGGNISALGEFSILTGLYPNPTATHFEMNNQLHLPTIATWLGKKYDSFFVSASNDLYFALGNNRTFNEYDNALRILPAEQKLYFNMFLDEPTAFHFFLTRINHAKIPFLGVYWSGATHFPYPDYSHQIQFLLGKTAYERYLNNLHLLDNEIKTLVTTLQNNKLLDHTILVVIGDHGELFGEHRMHIHGKTLYQNEIKIPTIIYAPKIITPQKINTPTSAIDVLPTILDVLNISTQNQLQGESLLRPNHRQYIFVYSDQDALASIDKQGNKMQISFANGTCYVVNLKSDPQEEHNLPCTNQQQLKALLEYRHIQPWILTHYNLK